MDKVLFSRKSDEWETPLDLFDKLDAEFNFNLDPCATDENHKTPMYFTREQNGLSVSWGGTMSSVIHLIVRSASGLRRHTGKDARTIPLLCC